MTRQFESTTAGDIYDDLGADDAPGGGGGQQPVNPKYQPIHCFGGSAASVAAAASGTATCTPAGMIIRPDSIELFDVQAALITITAITVGGLPIMHGGSLPGDMFRSAAQRALRPAIAASSTNPLAVTFTNNHTAALVVVVGVKGPVMRS